MTFHGHENVFHEPRKINGFQLGHENKKLQKKIHGSFMNISWEFYETKVGSAQKYFWFLKYSENKFSIYNTSHQ